MTVKLTAALLALILVISLAACGGSEPVSEISEASQISKASGEPSVAEETSDTDLRSELESLIARDAEVISLLIYGGIGGEADGYEYSPLPDDSPYHLFSAVTELLASVYTDASGTSARFLSYPTSAGASVVDRGGETYVCFADLPEKIPAIASCRITLQSDDGASVEARLSDGSSLTVGAALTENGWRLESSLFFLYTDSTKYPSWEDSGLENGQNEGSAARLTGNCLVINVFIDDAYTSWESASKKEALGFVNDAAAFLESECASYGGSLKMYVTNAETSLYLKTSRNIPTSLDDFLWIELLFADTTYRTLQGYAEANYTLTDYDNWCVLLHIDKKGRSYGLPCNSDYYDYRIYKAERAVMFYTSDKSYEYYSQPGVYAHEMLHLFGAEDLYGDYVDEATEMFMAHYFPNDIMRDVRDDIGESGVSPFTAYRVGWADSPGWLFGKIVTK